MDGDGLGIPGRQDRIPDEQQACEYPFVAPTAVGLLRLQFVGRRSQTPNYLSLVRQIFASPP